MMKIIRRIPVLIGFLLILISCSNELDVHMDKQYEGPVVYFILNPNDSVQYMRLQRVFLGDESAIVMAQNPDSIYPYGSVVILERLEKGEVVEEFSLEPTYDVPKDAGMFTSEKHLLYRLDHQIQSGYTYRMRVDIPNNELTVLAETTPYDELKILEVNRWPNGINMVNTKFAHVSWLSLPGTEAYQLTIRFHYYDLTVTDTIKRYIDWKLPRITSRTIKGGEIVDISIPVRQWYLYLGEHIQTGDEIVKRVAGKFDYRWDFAGTALETYMMQDQTQRNGLLTDYPKFSNIQNGIGLFSYRSYHEVIGYNISVYTLERLTIHEATKYMKFDGRQSW